VVLAVGEDGVHVGLGPPGYWPRRVDQSEADYAAAELDHSQGGIAEGPSRLPRRQSPIRGLAAWGQLRSHLGDVDETCPASPGQMEVGE